ncbi:MAG TPA: tetratricopeptide repeat protein, partial [Candidatus Binataceae bacterium]|nr:tetratricopeptide repeat protein [Candidatus Binataceae bacterium]
IERLCGSLEDPRQLFRAGMALWGYAVGCGDWKQAHLRVEQNLPLAERIGEPRHLAAVQRAAGHGLFFLGRFDEARVHLEQALTIAATVSQGQSQTFSYARNVVSDAATALSWTWEILGDSEKALQMIRRALRTAEEDAGVPELTSVTCSPRCYIGSGETGRRFKPGHDDALLWQAKMHCRIPWPSPPCSTE